MNTRISTPITILAISCLLAAGSTFAQAENGEGKGKRGGRGGPPSVEERLARINERLGLSDEQSVQMLKAMQAHEQERKALMDANMEEMAPVICAMQDGHEAAILEILDDNQEVEFIEMKDKFKNRAKGRRGGRGDGPGRIDCSTINY